ncbi:MAG: permease [Chloroflexota bacterium]
MEWFTRLVDTASNFSAVFLGIFIEASPFLLLGTLASGLVDVFFNIKDLNRLVPRNRYLAVVVGGLMGLFFPVCECGSVPLARRLMRKGLPVPVGIAFLLAAPVINPIVLASTFAAFGNTPVFWLRFALTLLIAVFTGMLFLFEADRQRVVRDFTAGSEVAFHPLAEQEPATLSSEPPLGKKIRQVLVVATDEFFELGKYLVIGALMAALMQTFVPQSWLLTLGQGPVFSTVVMMLLAVLLSICSTVDSFIALAFTGIFSSGSILAFLVYGPMVDIKVTLMYWRVFSRRTVLVLILIPLLMTLVSGIVINMWVQ